MLPRAASTSRSWPRRRTSPRRSARSRPTRKRAWPRSRAARRRRWSPTSRTGSECATSGCGQSTSGSPARLEEDPRMTSGTALFRQARDTLIEHRTDYERAGAAFSWPRLQQFNWALDWFDVIARDNTRPALRIVGDGGRDVSLSFEELRQRSNRLANHLRALGLRRGDRILLMLGNVPNLWELMLAAIKLSCPIIP